MDVYAWTTDLEQDARLDRYVETLDGAIPSALREGPLHEALSGTWLGHAFHPLMTDFPLGLWTSATVLDLLGARRWRRASATLTGLGLVLVAPTVASGMVEFLAATREERRVATVHAASNTVGAACYLVSFVAKVRGRPRLGAVAAVTGGLAATVGGYLGGHLSFARGVGVDPDRVAGHSHADDAAPAGGGATPGGGATTEVEAPTDRTT